MIKNVLILIILLTNYLLCSSLEIKVGKIDNFYKDKIDKNSLENIILEVEQYLENQLGYDLFNLSNNGIPIDLVYLPKSQLENKIENISNKIASNNRKLESINKDFYNNKIIIQEKKEAYRLKVSEYNKSVKKLNKFIKENNNKKNISLDEFEKLKKYIDSEKNRLNKSKRAVLMVKKELDSKIDNYNKDVIKYNKLVKESNQLNINLESLTRNSYITKGKTFITKKYEYKKDINTNKVFENSVSFSTNKIEIYTFNNLNELKALIAHEIGHAYGVGHTNSKNSLMNPILQKNQINRINLSYDDISMFNQARKNFR